LPCTEAYLDIETTGLSSWDCEITVIGVHLYNGIDKRFIQLVGEAITADSVLQALHGVEVIYTYNGSRFDLPFIASRLGIDLALQFRHRDLMYDCWSNGLYGGFKAVERQLGIDRRLKGMNGFDAVRLWWKYVNEYDQDALTTLLEYNKEDVLNLRALKEKLPPDF